MLVRLVWKLVRATHATELADHRDVAGAGERLRVDLALKVVPPATNVYKPGFEVAVVDLQAALLPAAQTGEERERPERLLRFRQCHNQRLGGPRPMPASPATSIAPPLPDAACLTSSSSASSSATRPTNRGDEKTTSNHQTTPASTDCSAAKTPPTSTPQMASRESNNRAFIGRIIYAENRHGNQFRRPPSQPTASRHQPIENRLQTRPPGLAGASDDAQR